MSYLLVIKQYTAFSFIDHENYLGNVGCVLNGLEMALFDIFRIT
jgi:hypothetical protein